MVLRLEFHIKTTYLDFFKSKITILKMYAYLFDVVRGLITYYIFVVMIWSKTLILFVLKAILCRKYKQQLKNFNVDFFSLSRF